MVVAVISDTHMPRGARRLPEAFVERIRGADLLLHAGDFTTVAVLRELEAIGPPLLGVYGNVDSTPSCATCSRPSAWSTWTAPASACSTMPVRAPVG